MIAAAIGAGLLLEALKYLNVLVWPWVDARIQREYGVFRYSATILFLSFFASMLVLAGAEWAARGHRQDEVEIERVMAIMRHAGRHYRSLQRSGRDVCAKAGRPRL